MEFSIPEEVASVRELAAQIFSEQQDDAALRRFDRGEIRWHDGIWKLLAEAGLVGVAIPEDAGGSGLGFAALCAVLEEQGRHVSALPLLATAVLGAMPIARFGSAALQSRWLAPAARGEAVLSGVLALSAAIPDLRSSPRLSPAAEGWRIDGVLDPVPYGEDADAILVPAIDDEGATSIFVVARGSAGLGFETRRGTNHEPFARVACDGVAVTAAERIGAAGDGRCILEWVAARAATAQGFIQLGVLADALRRTAQHTVERRQFGKPLAGFQAVAHRAADAYIDIEALRSTLWQAAWRIGEELPAQEAVSVAAWWACEAGHRVGHACQHLHGGTGADLDYPIHRYYLWAQQSRLCLGGSPRILATLGATISRQQIEVGL